MTRTFKQWGETEKFQIMIRSSAGRSRNLRKRVNFSWIYFLPTVLVAFLLLLLHVEDGFWFGIVVSFTFCWQMLVEIGDKASFWYKEIGHPVQIMRFSRGSNSLVSSLLRAQCFRVLVWLPVSKWGTQYQFHHTFPMLKSFHHLPLSTKTPFSSNNTPSLAKSLNFSAWLIPEGASWASPLKPPIDCQVLANRDTLRTVHVTHSINTNYPMARHFWSKWISSESSSNCSRRRWKSLWECCIWGHFPGWDLAEQSVDSLLGLASWNKGSNSEAPLDMASQSYRFWIQGIPFF